MTNFRRISFPIYKGLKGEDERIVFSLSEEQVSVPVDKKIMIYKSLLGTKTEIKREMNESPQPFPQTFI